MITAYLKRVCMYVCMHVRMCVPACACVFLCACVCYIPHPPSFPIPNATTASHGLYKLEIVVIADSRMLALYLYFLINHIQFRSVAAAAASAAAAAASAAAAAAVAAAVVAAASIRLLDSLGTGLPSEFQGSPS